MLKNEFTHNQTFSKKNLLFKRIKGYFLPPNGVKTQLPAQRALLASIASTLPLKKPSFLLEKETRQYILRKSEGTIGEIITLLSKAAILAIEAGEECIDLKLLMQTDYDSPTERRNKFERELH